MRHLILGLLVIGFSAQAQKKINKSSVNELELNTPLSQYENDLRFITGQEEIYEKHPNLKENVLASIRNGIREGLYGGYTFDLIDGVRASRTTFFFYKEELYKVRWFFLRSQISDFSEVTDQLSTFLSEKYGQGEEQIPELLHVWKSKKRYLQAFSDENEYQIEYRDEKIQKKVDKLM